MYHCNPRQWAQVQCSESAASPEEKQINLFNLRQWAQVSVVSPLHPYRKNLRTTVTCDSGLRSSVVSPLHPCRKEYRTTVTCDSGLKSSEVSPLHSPRKNPFKLSASTKHSLQRGYRVFSFIRNHGRERSLRTRCWIPNRPDYDTPTALPTTRSPPRIVMLSWLEGVLCRQGDASERYTRPQPPHREWRPT
jgi:hypothetical protein